MSFFENLMRDPGFLMGSGMLSGNWGRTEQEARANAFAGLLQGAEHARQAEVRLSENRRRNQVIELAWDLHNRMRAQRRALGHPAATLPADQHGPQAPGTGIYSGDPRQMREAMFRGAQAGPQPITDLLDMQRNAYQSRTKWGNTPILMTNAQGEYRMAQISSDNQMAFAGSGEPVTDDWWPARPPEFRNFGGYTQAFPYGHTRPNARFTHTLEPAQEPDYLKDKTQTTVRAKDVENARIALANAPQEVPAVLYNIDSLLSHPGMKMSTGTFWGRVPGTEAWGRADFIARFEQVKGQSFVMAFETLRGAGTITEMETAQAAAALNRMDRATSEEELVSAIEDFRAAYLRGIQKLYNRAGWPMPDWGGYPYQTPDQLPRDAYPEGDKANLLTPEEGGGGLNIPITGDTHWRNKR